MAKLSRRSAIAGDAKIDIATIVVGFRPRFRRARTSDGSPRAFSYMKARPATDLPRQEYDAAR